MIPAITDVLPLPDYLLLLTFENGEKRQFDMKPYLHIGIFKELKDLNKFRLVRVSFDSIEWENNNHCRLSVVNFPPPRLRGEKGLTTDD